jgi:hypothetical protein
MAEFRIDPFDFGLQTQLDLAPLADGGFYAVWTRSYTAGGRGVTEIIGQRFEPDGDRSGMWESFDSGTIGPGFGSSVGNPYVATASSGWFAVSWGKQFHSFFPPPPDSFVVRFDASGGVNSADPLFYDPGWGEGYYGLVAAGEYGFVNGGGRLTMAGDGFTPTDVTVPAGAGHQWRLQDAPDGSLWLATRLEAPGGFQFATTHYDAQGRLIAGGGSFLHPTAGLQDLAVGPDGRTAVATTADIRFYGADGQLRGTAAARGSDRIEFLADGSLVHVWSAPDTDGAGVFAQRLDGSGQPLAAPFIVNTTQAGDQHGPVVEALADGRFVVAWEEPGPSSGSTGSASLFRGDVFEPLPPRVLGYPGPDILVGTAAGELILGMASDDVLTGLGGDDVLNGGAGVNTASYAHAATGGTIDLAAGAAFGGPEIGTDTLFLIQNVIGTAAGDVIGGSAGALANRLDGRGGDDLLFGWTGADTLLGGEGDDQLFGQQDDDVLLGDAGNDRLFGWAGDDVLTGGTGADGFMWTGAGEGTDRITDYSYAEGDLIDVVGDPASFAFYQAGTSVLIIDPGTGQAIFELQNTTLSNGLAIV